MDHLHAMRVFTRVVECRSFTRAADTLALPRSSITSLIKQLEAHVGVTLLQRNTRSLSLTEQGGIYYPHCVQLLAQLDEVESGLRGDDAAPRGRVRVDSPGALVQALLLPNLKDFRQKYPDVELILGINDRTIDVIGEGVDCVIRAGLLPDSSLVAKPLGELQWIVCGAAAYLSLHGEPRSIADLSRHEIVNYQAPGGRPREWGFEVDGEPRSIVLSGQLSINETQAYLQSCLEGLGLIQMTEFLVRPYLQTGRLREVLAELRAPPMPVSLVYPQRGRQSPSVRAFIAWLVELMERCPLSEKV